jgi:hypothetical protein
LSIEVTYLMPSSSDLKVLAFFYNFKVSARTLSS